jgi:hypothetical protein
VSGLRSRLEARRAIPVEAYLRLAFVNGGRARPAVDCFGLYRLVLGEQLGIWLDEFGTIDTPLAAARAIAAGTSGPGWNRVAIGTERAFDMVMMRGLVGTGRTARSLPLHVGCVLEPGRMLDIEATTGVMVREYRDTARFSALPTVLNRVLGIVRPVEIS